MAEIEDVHWWFASRRRIVAAAIERLCRPPERARILDVGCATGGNLAALSRYGRVVGLELDPEAAAIARGRGAGDVLRARLPEHLPFRAASFDLVAALDVIEHLEDDRGALRALAGVLRPGGAMLVTVPAFRWLWSDHDVSHHHFRRYRLAEVVERLEGAGLRVERATYFNTWLFPLIAAARLARRLLLFRSRGGAAARDGHDLSLPPGPVNRLLGAIFASERHLVPRVRLAFGVSVLACARRPA